MSRFQLIKQVFESRKKELMLNKLQAIKVVVIQTSAELLTKTIAK